MSRPVAIVSTAVDAATDAVVEALTRKGAPVVRIDSESYPFDLSVGVSLTEERLGFHIGSEPVEPRSLWFRRVRSPSVPDGMDPGVHEFCVREAQTLLHGLAHAAEARVMSPPAAISRAENKVAQLALARRLGFTVPETLVTNRPAAVQAMLGRHASVVCKPVRSGWFRDNDGEWSIYTSVIRENDLAHLESVRLAPSIFQPLVLKECDVRVTYVGGRVFVADIDSQSDEHASVDWRRTTNPKLPHYRGVLPIEVLSRIHALMADLGLVFGALDFIRDRDGRYVFLEVNPNGQWLWLDDILDLGITESVADWLRGSDE